MNKNFLNQEAMFLSVPNSKIYLAILKIFYKNHKFEEVEFKEGKEATEDEIYNYCKDLEEFKEIDKLQFENAIEQLCTWENLDKRPNLEAINRYEDFIKKSSLYSITNNSLILLEAIEKIETKEIENSNISTIYIDEIIKHLKALNKYDIKNKQKMIQEDIYNSWILIKENYELLDKRYTDYLKNFSNKNKIEFKNLIQYQEEISSVINDFINLLDEKKEKLMEEIKKIEEKFEKDLIPIIATETSKMNHYDYEIEKNKIIKIWNDLKEWFSNSKNSKSKKISAYTIDFIQKLLKDINSYCEKENYNINMKKEYLHILKLFNNCKNIEEAHKLSAYIFGISKIRHFKVDSDYNVSDDIESVYKEDDMKFILHKNKKIEHRKYIKKGFNEKTFEETKKEYEEFLKNEEINNYIENEILKDEIDTLSFTNKLIDRKILDVIQDLYFQGFTSSDNIATTKYGKNYKVTIFENERNILVSEDGEYEMPRCYLTLIK